MKKLLIFAVVATMFAACSKDATQDLAAAKPIDKFYATIADNDSRVQLNNACQTVWTKYDRVAVFNKTSDKCQYDFTGQTGDIKGELSYYDGRGNGYEIDKVIAVYPYNSANDIYEDGRLSIFLPVTQEYRKDSFDGNSNVMVARSETENLSFQNVMGWIRIALTGDKIVKTITLKGYNKEKLAGIVTIAEDLSIIDFAKDVYSNTITLDCGSGIRLTDTPTYFYITVVPQKFEKGFCVEITDANKNIVLISTNKAVAIERNHIVDMAKSICDSEHISNQIRYTTSDGKTITPNSYNGTIISNTYTNGKGVITFDCAQTSIGGGAFNNCSTLTSITIPNSVTQIGNSAFQGCVGLTNITIPDNVTSINSSVFSGCTSLCAIYGKHASADHRCYIVDGELKCFISTGITTYTIPDSVTSIGSYAFWNCIGLTNLTIPDSVTSIGSYAFSSCTSLANVIISDNITEIGDWAFGYCKGLKSINLPKSIKIIGYGSFSHSGIESINIPDSVEEIGQSSFSRCPSLKSCVINGNGQAVIKEDAFRACAALETVEISGVKSIDVFAFRDCTNLGKISFSKDIEYVGQYICLDCTALKSVYFNSITPCELRPDAFTYTAYHDIVEYYPKLDCTIYVPRESLDVYKSANGWKEYASQIEGYDFE